LKSAWGKTGAPFEQCREYADEIFAFLRFFKKHLAPVFIMRANLNLTERQKQGASGAQGTLRWLSKAEEAQVIARINS